MDKIKHSDIVEISQNLESKCSLFRQFWDMGLPTLTDEIPRAAIGFNKDGDAVSFLWNPEFWEELDNYTRSFVVGHEMLHVLLNHGKRMLIHKDDSKSNQAMDIVVNHILINEFGFDRDKLCFDWSEFCWVDTLFEFPNIPMTNKSYEHYYNILSIMDSPSKLIMDSHGILSEDGGGISNKLGESLIANDFSDKLLDIINENKFPDSIMGGSSLGQLMDLNKRSVKISKKWDALMKPSIYKPVEKARVVDTWVRDSRRLYDFMENNKDVFLQSRVSVVDKFKEKTQSEIWFFLDYSGSCYSYYKNFLDAANSLNAKKFKVRLFTFDTSVTEITTTTTAAIAGGGTHFSCINDTVNKLMKDGNNPPSGVWVITDGYASDSKIKPQNPERWTWFLTPRSTRSFIPRESKIENLSDFL